MRICIAPPHATQNDVALLRSVHGFGVQVGATQHKFSDVAQLFLGLTRIWLRPKAAVCQRAWLGSEEPGRSGNRCAEAKSDPIIFHLMIG
jgi:hypothetical protein